MDDRLDVEQGVFDTWGGQLAHQLAVKRVLLPDEHRVLQMVVLPSFEPESAVYVTSELVRRGRHRRQVRDTTLVTGRVTTQLGGVDTGEELRVSSPEVDWARAPIGEHALERLRAVWRAALLAARPCERMMMRCDGVVYHFAGVLGSGVTHSPDEGSVCGGLVALGTALAGLARLTNEEERPDRERAIAADADRLLARIRALP